MEQNIAWFENKHNNIQIQMLSYTDDDDDKVLHTIWVKNIQKQKIIIKTKRTATTNTCCGWCDDYEHITITTTTTTNNKH